LINWLEGQRGVREIRGHLQGPLEDEKWMMLSHIRTAISKAKNGKTCYKINQTNVSQITAFLGGSMGIPKMIADVKTQHSTQFSEL